MARSTRKTSSQSRTAATPVKATPATQGTPTPLAEVPLDNATRIAQLFGLKTIMTRPLYLAPSPWLAHVPFGFWLIDALRPETVVDLAVADGVSYFTFCQALERLGQPCECTGLEPWEPAVAAPQHMDQLRQHNSRFYAGFSTLVSAPPAGAADHFAAGSLDLLHLTVPAHSPTPQSAEQPPEQPVSETPAETPPETPFKALFESWQDRLSERGVVLVQGGGLGGPSAEDSAFLVELRERYPSFEFRHGGGLLVLGVGAAQIAPLSRLFEIGSTPAARSAVLTLFGRLGQACGDAQNACAYEALYQQSQQDVAQLQETLSRADLPSRGAPALEPPTVAISPTIVPTLSAQDSEEVLQLKEALDQRFQEIAALTTRLYEAENELHNTDLLEQELRQLRAFKQMSDKKAAELRAAAEEKDQLIEELHALRKEDITAREGWEHMCNEIRSSSSWKITAPLRALLNRTRR